jgi:hypothetical protein
MSFTFYTKCKIYFNILSKIEMFHLLEEVHKETKQETMIILHIVVKKKVKKIKLKNLKS